MGSLPHMAVPDQRGRIIGTYRLTERIGQGGMGVVWKALDTV